MVIQLSSHARDRMEERGITEREVEITLSSPQKIARRGDVLLAMKLRANGHLLIIVYREMEDIKHVVTVIDTSKVYKYL